MWMPCARLVPLIFLTIVSVAAVAQTPVAADAAATATAVADEEAVLLRKFAVATDLPRTYQDEDGKALSATDFLHKLQQGAKLSVTKSEEFVRFKLMDKSQMSALIEAHKTAKLNTAVGQPPPDFELTALDGQQKNNKSLLGRYTVINFFFAACAPCIAEIPSLNAFHAKHPELNLWAVTFDDVETTRKFLVRNPFQWQVLPNSRSFNKMLGVQSYPGFAVLSPQGKLLGFRLMGAEPTPDEAAGKIEHIRLSAWVTELIARDKAGS